MQSIWFDSPWIAIVLWIAIYSCDYLLTLYASHLWRKFGSKHIEVEGSYELNPYLRKDIDAMRLFSRRFLSVLIFGAIVLLVMWLYSRDQENPDVFSLSTGAGILGEIAAIATHIENIALFRFMRRPGNVEGKVKYARRVAVSVAAQVFAYWGLAYLFMFLISGNWFFFGGMLSSSWLFIAFGFVGQKLHRAAKLKSQAGDDAKS